MIRVGDSLFATGVVHNAAYGGIDHDAVSTVRKLALMPHLDVVEAAWPLEPDVRQPLQVIMKDVGATAIHAAGGQMRQKGINPNSLDRQERAQALFWLEQIVAAVSDMGAKLLVLCSGPDCLPNDRDEAKKYLHEMLCILCQRAKELRPEDPLWISFEHFDRELDQKRLLGPTSETVDFIRSVRKDVPNIGVLADLSHLVQLGETISQSIDAIGDLLIHAHVANCGLDPAYPAVYGDSHCRFGVEGSAVTLTHVIEFLSALDRNGLAKRALPTGHAVISVEMKTPKGGDPEISIANGLRMLYQASAAISSTR
ncbi:TIM barrel protein [uncultured Cohaesibacter sp.]|uniref:sugar phosphate isomerase/epimerase family protein n=1 Tax=uncultured Cohaesibacter sp. TaxID=1002546 RepID=UPI00292DC216|nr:TIM barrel protein [uncultured Cohaesibacter sp.]